VSYQIPLLGVTIPGGLYAALNGGAGQVDGVCDPAPSHALLIAGCELHCLKPGVALVGYVRERLQQAVGVLGRTGSPEVSGPGIGPQKMPEEPGVDCGPLG
jgi:hypothetical protein